MPLHFYRNKYQFLRYLLVALGLAITLFGGVANAQTTFTYNGGTAAWEAGASWTKTGTATVATYPGDPASGAGETHDVSIPSGIVTLSAADITTRVRNITIGTGRLQIGGVRTLAISGAIAKTSTSAIWLLGDGALTVPGTLQADTLSTIGNAIVRVGGDLDLKGSIVNGTTGANAEVIFNGSVYQTITRATNFRKLTMANVSQPVACGSGSLNVAVATSIPNGTELRLAQWVAHVLGTVTGSGTISIGGATSNMVWPSGTFTNFLAPGTGGTVMYYGNTVGYNITSVPSIGFNQVVFTGAGRRTLTVPATVNGGLRIDLQDSLLMSGTATLTMAQGLFYNSGKFRGAAGTAVRFSSTTAGQAIGGPGQFFFNDLILDKSGQNTTLLSPIRINGNLSFNSAGKLIQGSNDITLSATSRMIGNFAFSSSTMIEQDGTGGTGAVIKEATSASQLVTLGGNPVIFPIGSGGYYTPAQLTALTATVTGTGSLLVKTYPIANPGANALRRTWRLRTTNISSTTNAQVQFSFNGAEVNGTPDYVTRSQGGTYYAVTGSYYSGLVGNQTFGVNTTGNTFLEENWTLAKSTALPKTYYSYQSGSYDTPSTWTSDPSGSFLFGSPASGGPDNNDVAVILPGRTVTMTSGNKTLASTVINAGGVLDVGAYTGNNFGIVSGQGVFRLNQLAVPTGVYDDFVSPTGGTFEYFSIAGELPGGQLTYCNLLLSGTGTKIFASQAGSPKAYTIRGSLTVSGGTAQIGSEATTAWISVLGNVTVTTGASLTAATPLINHQLDIGGNFLNSGGTVNLSNRTPPLTAAFAGAASTSGYTHVRFIGASNNTAICNGPTNFNSIEVQKGQDLTWGLTLSTSDSSYFNLMGPNYQDDSLSENSLNSKTYKSLGIRFGTLVLGSKIKILSLHQGSGGQWRINDGACLVIDGSNVVEKIGSASGGEALTVYGRLKVISGRLDCSMSEGLIARGSGEVYMLGGYLRTNFYRPSTIVATTPRGLVDISGGQFDILGNAVLQNNYGAFCMPYATNVFRMSGGALNVYGRGTSSPANNQAVLIAATPGNVSVTGGTLNLIIPSTNRTTNTDMGISSSAPFWDVNISSLRANVDTTIGISVSMRDLQYIDGSTTYTIGAQDLVIQNNLTLSNFGYLRGVSATAGVRVGGNVSISANSYYQPNGSRFTMGGTTPFASVNQTLTCGYAVKFAKLSFRNALSGGVVTLAGTNPNATDTVSIDAGKLNDGGLTLGCYGSAIINSGQHLGTGRVKAFGYLNGTPQYLGGSGAGQWGTLEFASTVPASRSFALSANQIVNTSLILTNGVVDLSSYNLALGSATTFTPGVHATTRTLTSGGLETDGGITKTFSATSGAFIAPFMHGGLLRAVSLSVTAGTYGNATIIPANKRHPALTIPPATINDALKFYWRLNATGFSGITDETFTCNYVAADIPPSGNTNDDVNYVVGRYNNSLNYWTTEAYTTQTSNRFDYVNNANGLTGDYTAGNIASFGGIVAYESITNGAWTTPATWKRSQAGATVENPATTAPTSTSPIIVHSNHTVSVNALAGTITVPSLRIDTLGTLDLSNTTDPLDPHNFNTIQPGVPSNGTIKLGSSSSTGTFPKGGWSNFFLATGGSVWWYTVGGQSFTLPSTTAGGLAINSYRHLFLQPSVSSDVITTPAVNTQIYENLTVYGSGATNLSTAAAGNLTIGGSATIGGGGQLIYGSTGTARSISVAKTLTVAGTLTVATGGTLAHRLTASGDIINTGTINLEPGLVTESRANTTLSGTVNTVIAGAGPTLKFSQLTVNKGTSQTATVDVSASAFALGGTPAGIASAKPLYLQNGTFKLSANRAITVSSGASAGLFNIPGTAQLWVANGKVLLTGTGTTAGMQLDGTLQLSGTGVVRLDCGSTTAADNSIQYSAAATPALIMGGDSLLIGGQLRGNSPGATGSLAYAQSRGTVYVGFRNASVNKPMFEVQNAGSFIQTGGTIQIARSRASALLADVLLTPASYTVTGGTLMFGFGAYTPNATVFSINASAPVFNLTLNTGSSASNPAKLQLYTRALQMLGTATFNTNTTLTANNLDVKFGGDWVHNGTYTPGTNVTWFNSAIGNQTVSGTSTFVLTDATIANSYPNGTVTLAGTDWTINSDLAINSGTLAANSRNIYVPGNVYNAGKHTSTTGYLYLNGGAPQNIDGDGNGVYGSVWLDNSNNALALAPFTINGTLNIVNGLLDMQAQQLTLGVSATTTGTFSAARMIRTSGSSDDGGVRKMIATGAFNFTLPIGSGALYTPVSYNATANTSAGSITVRPVNNVHPLCAGGGATALAYYWSVSNTGLAGLNLTHTYTYAASSASGRGNESLYVGARLNAIPDWEQYPGAVNTTLKTITFSAQTYAFGDFTAGETSNFAPVTPFISAMSGPWTTAATWTNNSIPPTGSVVKVMPGHTVILGINNVSISTLQLQANGKLDVGTTTGHNLGTISGQGTLALGTANLPGGAYNIFTSTGGGTVEYNGAGYALPATRAVYNHLRINSTGTIPNISSLLTLNGDFILQAGTFTNQADQQIIIEGSLINSGTFVAGSNVSSQTLNIGAHLVNNGTFTSGSTNVVFNGTANQRVFGTSAVSLTNMQVLKNSGTLGISKDITISGVLSLDRGLVRLDTANLILAQACQVKPDIITSTSYVWATEAGKIIRKITSVPMQAGGGYTVLPGGDATRYLPFNFRLKTGTLSGAQVAMKLTMSPHPQRVAATRYVNYFWTLEPTGITTPSYDATYKINAKTDIYVQPPGTDPRANAPYKYSGGIWSTGGSYDTTQLAYSWNNVTSFSDFTGGTGLGDPFAPLPVTFTGLTAKVITKSKADVVALTWHTSSEENLDAYYVERSQDGRIWRPMAHLPVQATAANSRTHREYTWTDLTPLPGTTLYRVRAEDRNGVYTYTNNASATIKNAVTEMLSLSALPNPGKQQSQVLRCYGLLDQSAELTVVNAQGIAVFKTTLSADSGKDLPLAEMPTLPTGLYYATLRQGDGQARCRVVVE